MRKALLRGIRDEYDMKNEAGEVIQDREEASEHVAT